MSQPGGKKGGAGKGPLKDKNDDSKENKNGKYFNSFINTQNRYEAAIFILL